MCPSRFYTGKSKLGPQCAKISVGTNAEPGVARSNLGLCPDKGVSASRKVPFSEKSGVHTQGLQSSLLP